jgi:hypothetical protein
LLASKLLLIGEPLPDDATYGSVGSGAIIAAVCNPVVIAEFELGKVTMQVLLATVLIDALEWLCEQSRIIYATLKETPNA